MRLPQPSSARRHYASDKKQKPLQQTYRATTRPIRTIPSAIASRGASVPPRSPPRVADPFQSLPFAAALSPRSPLHDSPYSNPDIQSPYQNPGDNAAPTLCSDDSS